MNENLSGEYGFVTSGNRIYLLGDKRKIIFYRSIEDFIEAIAGKNLQFSIETHDDFQDTINLEIS